MKFRVIGAARNAQQENLPGSMRKQFARGVKELNVANVTKWRGGKRAIWLGKEEAIPGCAQDAALVIL